MKPKVCYVIPEYKVDTATHLAHVYDTVREIAKRTTLFLVVEKGARPSPAFGYHELRVAHFKWTPLRALELFLMFLQARFKGYKVFYVHYSFAAAFAASFVAQFFGGSVLYWNCGEPWKYKRPFFREWFERLVYRRITSLVTGASSLADKYAETYGLKRDTVTVIPNSIRLDRFRGVSRAGARKALDIPSKRKMVLYVHRLSSRKGADTIMAVAQEVIATNPEALFIIVGEGPEQRVLRREVEDKGLAENIRIEGKIPNAELPTYFAAADVFFMPSEEEGFPRVILEAMSVGVPVAGSDVGAVREILPPELRRFITEPGDIWGFAERIRELIDPATEKAVSPGSLKRYVERYDTSRVVQEFINLFEKHQSLQ